VSWTGGCAGWRPAGGTGYGLAHWGAELVPGARTIAELAGLPDAIRRADLVITGEGRFDAGSLTGKACGYVLRAAAGSGVPALVVAGSVAAEMAALMARSVAGSVARPVAGTGLHSLTELAGSPRAAQDDPVRWLRMAGRQAAEKVGMP
jgi:glycerate 2-kinase